MSENICTAELEIQNKKGLHARAAASFVKCAEEFDAEITVERILTDVGAAFGVTADDMRSANRNAQISLGRKVAVYIIREVKGMSFTAIGDEFHRNHSTMTISYADVKEMMTTNHDLKETIEDLIKNLKTI